MYKVTALSSVWLDDYPELNQTLPGGSSFAFAAAIKRYASIEVTLHGLICDNGKETDELWAEINKRGINNLVYMDRAHDGCTARNTVHLKENGEHYNIPGEFYAGSCCSFNIDSERDKADVKSSDLIHVQFGTPEYRNITYCNSYNQISIDFGKMHDFHILSMNTYAKYIFVDATTDEDAVLNFFANCTDYCYKIALLGSKGSVVYDTNKKRYSLDAIKVDNVVDTNGCNECYQAGFLAKMLETGDVEQAMQEGAKLYAECSQQLGALLPMNI